MSTSADRFMPEVVEVEPLQRRLAAVVLEPRGVLADVAPDRLLARAGRELDPLGEALQMQRVAAFLLEAEEEVHRAFEQMREDHRPLRERRRLAEEERARAAAVLRGGRAIADDDEDLPLLDTILEQHGGVGAEVGDLEQVLGEARIGAAQRIDE